MRTHPLKSTASQVIWSSVKIENCVICKATNLNGTLASGAKNLNPLCVLPFLPDTEFPTSGLGYVSIKGHQERKRSKLKARSNHTAGVFRDVRDKAMRKNADLTIPKERSTFTHL